MGSEWKTIDTAPKDGTRLLVWIPELTDDDGLSYPEQYALAHWRMDCWIMGQGQSWSDAGAIENRFVWQALPPPPGELT